MMKHRWDYEEPVNWWEAMPWWVRWPLVLALVVYFGGGLLAGTVALWGM